MIVRGTSNADCEIHLTTGETIGVWSHDNQYRDNSGTWKPDTLGLGLVVDWDNGRRTFIPWNSIARLETKQ